MEDGTKNNMIKIGVVLEGFCSWQGGIDFCMNIMQALCSLPGNHEIKKYDVYCLIPLGFLKKDTLSHKVVIERGLLGITVLKRIPDVKVRFYNGMLDNVIEKYSLDILLPVFSCGDYTNSIPCIGYIADLQHKYLQNFFSWTEIQKRDEFYIACLNKFKYIIVNSESVKKDLEKYYSPYKANIIVLPCLPLASRQHFIKKEDIARVKRKYGLPAKYFIISNQFWMHKNHSLAFRALEKLYGEGYTNIYLVCTGKMEDNRNKNYINELLEIRNELICKNNILFLGLIPKKDQLSIMKNAIAVVQPTKFEGGPGGGSVYDAVSMQVPCIVSNIDVNKELPRSNRIFYFEVNCIEDLAEKMAYVLKQKFSKKSNRIVESLQKRNLRLYKDYFDVLITKIINETQN